MDEEFTKIMQNTDPHSQGEYECHGDRWSWRSRERGKLGHEGGLQLMEVLV